MKNSINYNLKLPEIQDIVKVSDLSENFIEIDKQMKINSDAITNMEQVEVVDNLTSTAKDKALSANQGSQLKGAINGINTSLSSHKAESTQQAHLAKNIRLEDMAGNFVATELEGAMNELFTNVSNGKQLVGGAITGVDNSVIIPTDPTFQQLANAIGLISTGKKWASGSVGPLMPTVTISGLGFRPSIVIIYVEPATNTRGSLLQPPSGAYGQVDYSWSMGQTGGSGSIKSITIKDDGFSFKGQSGNWTYSTPQYYAFE